MLKCIPILNPEEKLKIFEQIDISKSTWVVSDLTSKLSFQKKIFHKQEIVEDESLLRANELWIKLLTRLRPDYKIISQDTAIALIKNYLEDNKDEEWAQRPGVPHLLLQYTQNLLPVVNHPDTHDVMKEFFKKNIESFQKWGHWYLLAREIFHYFLEKKMILHSWIPAVLLYENLSDLNWDKEFYFDLGTQLLPAEAELLSNLAKSKTVNVLVPDESWFSSFSKTLKSYENLRSYKKETLEIDVYKNTVDFIKVSTCLAEVQHVCSLVRDLLDKKKVLPGDIAISAPDIGIYWSCLKEYFDTEGIPLNRSTTSTFITFPEFQQWLSKLKLIDGELERTYLEMVLTGEITFPLRHEKFFSLFANIYSPADLKKITSQLENFKFLNSSKKISLINFLNIALSHWKNKWPTDKLKIIIEKIYSEMPLGLELAFKSWLEIFEQKIAKTEMVIEYAYDNGIEIVDLISLKDLGVKYAFIMGLTDKDMRTQSKVMISDFDSDYLKQNYGYIVSDPEKNDLEFELVWNLNNKNRKNYLFFPHSNFEGAIQAASHIWLKGAVEKYGTKVPLTIPSATRLSEIQTQDIADIQIEKKWTSLYAENLEKQLLKDSGLLEECIGNIKVESISASQIEDYLRCPFIHASKKLFSLNDLPDLDLDLDYQTRGKLLHGMAELTHLRYPDLDLTEENISSLFDEVVANTDFQILDTKMWVAQKNKYIKIFTKYLDFERKYRANFPSVKTQMVEQNIHVYIDPQSLDVSKDYKKDYILVRGKIDRIDMSNEGSSCLIIDYKFNSTNHNNHNKWLDENEIQLALYSYLVESGALDHKYDVLGAVYYGFKNLNRHKGFLMEEAAGQMFHADKKKVTTISLQEKKDLYEGLKGKISDTVRKMQMGEYYPKPADDTTCLKCSWRVLCRAPHLN